MKNTLQMLKKIQTFAKNRNTQTNNHEKSQFCQKKMKNVKLHEHANSQFSSKNNKNQPINQPNHHKKKTKNKLENQTKRNKTQMQIKSQTHANIPLTKRFQKIPSKAQTQATMTLISKLLEIV